jgi:hypothetical protein
MEENFSPKEPVAKVPLSQWILIFILVLLLVACLVGIVAGLASIVPTKTLAVAVLVGLADLFVYIWWSFHSVKHYDWASNQLPTAPKILVFFFVLQLPIVVTWILNNILPAVPWTWLLILVQINWGLWLMGGLMLISIEKNREILFGFLTKYSAFAPVVFPFTFLWITISFFASLTFILLKDNTLSWFTQGKQDITINQLSYFYLWHFVDAIPVLKITSTLRWNEPLTY